MHNVPSPQEIVVDPLTLIIKHQGRASTDIMVEYN